jgi:putative membrane protein
MKIIKILTLALILAACNGRNSNNETAEQDDAMADDMNNNDDAEFAKHAAEDGMLEVQLANLAREKSASEEVKQYAEMIADDHTAANKELDSIADIKNIVLPVALSGKNQKVVNDFMEKSGEDFDKAYCDLMTKAHKKAIDDFEDQAENGNDPALKAWAAGKVSVLQHHLEMAESMDESMASK